MTHINFPIFTPALSPFASAALAAARVFAIAPATRALHDHQP